MRIGHAGMQPERRIKPVEWMRPSAALLDCPPHHLKNGEILPSNGVDLRGRDA